MSNKGSPPTAVDVLVMSLSPILIMGLVGSLVFFLAEVFYAGQYEGRLLYTLFFFVVGAVLVGRIAVVVDRTRAWAYGGVLAIITFIALRVWVEYPEGNAMGPFKDLINAVLIFVVWWASNRLVWDCTFIDENRTGSGQGLLVAAGWEKRPGTRPDVVEDVEEDERRYVHGMAGWYQRYAQWQKARAKRPHTPGLTVVYFALAALPIYGLGQAIIPADETARRNFTFWTTASYVACSLALLLTTSFLGLRRYLRQRKLKMPVAMTASWMGMGGILILLFVVVGALLPRPYSETPIWNPGRVASKDRNASQYAQNRDSGGKGEGRNGEQATKGDGKATGKGGEPGAKGNGDAKKGSGEKDGKSGSGDDKNGKSGGDNKGEKGDKGDPAKGKQEQNSNREAKDQQKSNNQENSKSTQSQQSSTSAALGKVATVLKWVMFAVVALIVLFVVFRHGLQFLANFMPWAKNLLASIDAWLKSLFGRRERPVGEASEANNTVLKEQHVPFTAFSNPFADGTESGRSVEELVRYSFQALEAWAADREQPRHADETPIEFAQRLGQEFDWLHADARRLAILVARMAYSPERLPKEARQTLDTFWDRLTSGATVPATDPQ